MLYIKNNSYKILIVCSSIFLLTSCQPLSKHNTSTSPAPKKTVTHSTSQAPTNVVNQITSDVNNVHEAISQGEEYLAKGKQEKAMVYFIRALQFDNRNIKALEHIATLHYRKGNSQAAKQVYTQILVINSNHITANEQLGMILLNERNMSLAKKHFIKAIRLDNRQWKSHNSLGIVFDMENKHSVALQHYQNALAIEPSNPILLNNTGYSYYLSGNDYEAENYFKKAIQFNNSYKRAIDNLALLKTKHKQFSTAVSLLNTVMEPYEAYNSVGYLCMLQKQYQQAEFYFHKAINESPYFYPKAVENLEILKDLQVQNQSTPQFKLNVPKKVTSHTSKPVTNKQSANSLSPQKTNAPATTPKKRSFNAIPLTVPVVSVENTEKKATVSPPVDISSHEKDISEKETTIQPDNVDPDLSEVIKNTDSVSTKIETVTYSKESEPEKINTIKKESTLPKNAVQKPEKSVDSPLPENSSDIAIIGDSSKEKNTSPVDFQSPAITKENTSNTMQNSSEYDTSLESTTNETSKIEKPVIVNNDFSRDASESQNTGEPLPDSNTNPTNQILKSQPEATPTDSALTKVETVTHPKKIDTIKTESTLPDKIADSPLPENSSDIATIDDSPKEKNTSTADFQSPANTKENTTDTIQNSSEYDTSLDSTDTEISRTEKSSIVNNNFTRDASESQITGELRPDSNTNPTNQILKSQPEEIPTDSASTTEETVTHPETIDPDKINTIKTDSTLPEKAAVSPLPGNSSDLATIDNSSKEKNTSTADFQSPANTKENTPDTIQNSSEYDTSLDSTDTETSRKEKPSTVNSDFTRDTSESQNTDEPLPDSNTNPTRGNSIGN